MNITSHELKHAEDAGNGYHGRCIYCRVALCTDLGYDSWSGVKCIERPIEYENDIPDDILSYANFAGYRWSNKEKVFSKPSFSNKLDDVTLDEMNKRVLAIKNK